MNNQSTALEGGAMPSAFKFNPLTTGTIAVWLGYLRNLGSLGWAVRRVIDYPKLSKFSKLSKLTKHPSCVFHCFKT